LANDQASLNHTVLRWGKKIAIAIFGGLVLIIGILMIVLPGPALIVIPLGLGILSLEFERPRIWLIRLRRTLARIFLKFRQRWRQRFSRC
jgi:tellurite resistance protein TerC